MPMKLGDGTVINPKAFAEVRLGDGTVLWSPDGATSDILVDSFENYDTGATPPNWTVQDGVVSSTESGSDGSQAFRNDHAAGSSPSAYIESSDPDGDQPTEITWAYWETSASGGHAYVVEDTLGNPILKLGTHNPQVRVEHGGGTTTLTTSPSPSMEAWRRFTVTFDWDNETFDVLWEDVEGTSADETATDLAFMNTGGGGIGRVWIGNASFSTGGTGVDGSGAERDDEVWGVDTITDESGDIIVADFNDGTLTHWTGDTGEFSFSSSADAYEGDHAIVATGSSADEITSSSGLDNYPKRGDIFEYRFYAGEGNERPTFWFFEEDDDNKYGIFTRIPDGQLVLRSFDAGVNTKLDEQTGITWPTDEWLRIEIDTSDTVNNTITVTAYNAAGTQLGQVTADNNDNNGTTVALLENASTTPGECRFDYIRITTQS